jgi:hypothetical protein
MKGQVTDRQPTIISSQAEHMRQLPAIMDTDEQEHPTNGELKQRSGAIPWMFAGVVVAVVVILIVLVGALP